MEEEKLKDLKDRKIIYKILTIVIAIILCLSLHFIAAIIVGLIGAIINKVMNYKIECRYDELLEKNSNNIEKIEKKTK